MVIFWVLATKHDLDPTDLGYATYRIVIKAHVVNAFFKEKNIHSKNTYIHDLHYFLITLEKAGGNLFYP